MSHALNIHDGLGIIAKDPAKGILMAYGDSVPGAIAGYAPGCKFIKTNGTSLATTTFVNVGTKTSANFVTEGSQSTSPSIGIGYATGAGGSVTQITSAATGVTLNKVCGRITTVALTTAAGADEQFTVTNSAVAATDIVIITTTYAGAGTILVGTAKVVAGAFDVVITNLHASNALNAVAVINFAIIKSVIT
mgnify:CR=1 FL=1